MMNNRGFDEWADDYDMSVEKNGDRYPFDGYYNVLNKIYDSIENKHNVDILDIGIGTGTLSSKLYKEGANIVGVDFSEKMLSIAKSKMSDAKLIKCNFSAGLPNEVINNKFDYIIASYSLHHLNDDEKNKLFNNLLNSLKDNGKIIVGDVGFIKNEDLLECRNNNIEDWDSSEFYLVLENLKEYSFNRKVRINYEKISSCAIVIEIY